MSDIVERLRGNGLRPYFGDSVTMYDAATEIERLRDALAAANIELQKRTAAALRASAAEIERLRGALRDTLDFCELHSNRWDGINGKHPALVVNAARAALNPSPQTGEPVSP